MHVSTQKGMWYTVVYRTEVVQYIVTVDVHSVVHSTAASHGSLAVPTFAAISWSQLLSLYWQVLYLSNFGTVPAWQLWHEDLWNSADKPQTISENTHSQENDTRRIRADVQWVNRYIGLVL